MKRGNVTKGDYVEDTRVARYLNRASRGLWGRDRARLRDELSIHIDGLVNSYRMAGVPLDEAVDRALREMGPATKVSVGIARLNALPLMSVMGLLACAVIAITTMFAPIVAQSITPLDTFPTAECMADEETAWFCNGRDWVSIDELKTLLEQQNVGVNQVGDNLFLRIPGYDKVLVRGGSLTYTFYNIDMEGGVTRSTETGYIQIRTFLEALAIADIPVRLNGWDNLTIGIADKSFDLIVSENYDAQDFYKNTLYETLSNLAPPPGSGYVVATKHDLPSRPFQFGVDTQVGEVYAVFIALNEKTFQSLMSIPAGEDDTAAFYYDLARVEADGKLSLNLPDMDNIQFTSAAETMAGNGKALLVRLTGEVGKGLYTVIPPDEVSLEPQ